MRLFFSTGMFEGNPDGNFPRFSTFEKSIFSITVFSTGRSVFLKRFGYLEYPRYASAIIMTKINIPTEVFILESDSPPLLFGIGGIGDAVGITGGGVGTVFIGFEFILKLFGGMVIYFYI